METPTVEHPTGRDNFTRVDVGGVTFWYSYRTVVAVNMHDGRGPIVRENEWGPTTGKHLNYIDGGDKAARVSGAELQALIASLPNLEPQTGRLYRKCRHTLNQHKSGEAGRCDGYVLAVTS